MLGNIELLQIVESVSKDKGISREQLILAMESAIEAVGKKKYGNEYNIKAEVSKKTGEIKLFRILVVSLNCDDIANEISLEEARKKKNDVEIGDKIYELLPPIELGRIFAQVAKNVIIQKVNEIEREKQYHDFKGKIGEIVNGTVKRLEFGNLIIDLGRAEAILKKDQLIQGENFKINDRIKAYVQNVISEQKGPQIFLSRTDNGMLYKLFELEVPEIYDNIIEIKSIAREPGSKSKVAVFAADSSTDAIGSCVGIRGNRVKSIIDELNGEKIDILLWNKNIAQFVINAMVPAEISKIVIDEDKHKIEVIVPFEKLSIAIGRRGQNVRLASKLTGWNIDVITEEQESKRRTDEFNHITELFIQALDVEEVIAQLLVVENYTSVEQIAVADVNTLSAIEGFDYELASELKERAVTYISDNRNTIVSKLSNLGVEDDLLNLLSILSFEDILTLAEYGIKTMEDLTELTLQEFRKLLPKVTITDDSINALIDAAKVFNKEDI